MLELGDIASVYSGVSVQEASDGFARFMRLSDLSDIKAGRRPILAVGIAPAVARALALEDGDLVVGARGSGTDVCLVNETIHGAFISLDLYLVRPNRAKVNPKYLAAFLELPGTQSLLSTGKQGTGLARLSKDALEKTRVPLPSLHTQILIADLALSFETEVRLLKKLGDLKTYFGREAVAQAIYRAAPDANPKGNHDDSPPTR